MCSEKKKRSGFQRPDMNTSPKEDQRPSPGYQRVKSNLKRTENGIIYSLGMSADNYNWEEPITPGDGLDEPMGR